MTALRRPSPLVFLLLLLAFTPFTLAARLGGGRVRPSFGGSSGGSYSKPATGIPAYTAVGYPVNRPVQFSRPSTFPGAGYSRPYGGFFPGTVPIWIFGAGALYASGSNYALVDKNGAPAACDLPPDSIDAYKLFNDFDSIVNGTVISNSTIIDNASVAPSAEQIGTEFAAAQGPAAEEILPEGAAAPAGASLSTAVSEADRQAVLQAVETGQLNLDTINPALINQTYLLEQCSGATKASAVVVMAVVALLLLL